jgi:hypothetical protein
MLSAKQEPAMRNFAAGLILGLIIGSSAFALAQTCLGNGELNGWDVMLRGKKICSDPDIDAANREIECH